MGCRKFKWFSVVTSQMSATSGKGVNNELFIRSTFYYCYFFLFVVVVCATPTTFVHK